MLEAKEVVKSFDGFRALDSATLTVPKGTVYGLVGPNGAGKSTIIRHFTGVYRPDSGQLLLEGAPIWENTDAKRRMVVIPDDWYYFPQASIAEMAKLYAGAYPSFSWERYEKMKQVFPLNDRQMLRRMSKGMQKQAAFWLTMCCMPEYLILDEPVDGLDPVMRRQVWSLLLGDVAERGTTVLGEFGVSFEESIRGRDVFLVQSTFPNSPSENLVTTKLPSGQPKLAQIFSARYLELVPSEDLNLRKCPNRKFSGNTAADYGCT